MVSERFNRMMESLKYLEDGDQLLIMKIYHGLRVSEKGRSRLESLRKKNLLVNAFLTEREQPLRIAPRIRRMSISQLLMEHGITGKQSLILFQLLHGEKVQECHQAEATHALTDPTLTDFLWRAAGISFDLRRELKARGHAPPKVAELAERHLIGMHPHDRSVLTRYALGERLDDEEWQCLLAIQQDPQAKAFLDAQLNSFERAVRE